MTHTHTTALSVCLMSECVPSMVSDAGMSDSSFRLWSTLGWTDSDASLDPPSLPHRPWLFQLAAKSPGISPFIRAEQPLFDHMLPLSQPASHTHTEQNSIWSLALLHFSSHLLSLAPALVVPGTHNRKVWHQEADLKMGWAPHTYVHTAEAATHTHTSMASCKILLLLLLLNFHR